MNRSDDRNEAAADTAGRPTRYRWAVLAIAVVTYMLAGADRANLGIAIPYMKREFALSNSDIGLAASVFFIGMTAMQLPASLVLQRIGVRTTMAAAILLTSLSTLAVGLVGNVTQLIWARSALGLAEGPINIGCLTIINRWFPPRERGTAVGIFVASIKLAPALVPPIGATIIYFLGWRAMFYIFAAPGILVALLWWVLVTDKPQASRRVNAAEVAHIEAQEKDSEAKNSEWRDWGLFDRLMRTRSVTPLDTNAEVLKSGYIWICALGYSLLAGLTYAIMTWIPTYLVEVKGYPLLQTGFVSAAPWVGAVIGSIAGGFISDKLLQARRKPLMLITSGATIVTMYSLIGAPNDPSALSVLLVVTGVLLTLGYSTFLAYPMGLATPDRVPVAVALVSLMGAFGGGMAPYAVGVILDRYGWTSAFGFLSICALCAMLLVLLLIEPRPARPTPGEAPQAR